MKKAKIMLASIALFAVVGGALAFKTKFNSSFTAFQFTTDAPSPNLHKTGCFVPVVFHDATISGTPTITITSYSVATLETIAETDCSLSYRLNP